MINTISKHLALILAVSHLVSCHATKQDPKQLNYNEIAQKKEHAKLKEGARSNHVWNSSPEMPGYIKAATKDYHLLSQEFDSDGALHQKYSTDPEDLEELESLNTVVFSDGIKQRRKLYDDISDPASKSNLCKTSCIDEGLVFCPNQAFTGGYCCLPTENCPRYDMCSTDNVYSPLFFKYITCPNEEACEEKEITPEYDGEVLKRKVDEYQTKFVKDDVCSYIVYSPWQMTEWDRMYIKIYSISNAEVYLAKGKGYVWFDHLDQMVQDGDVFDTSADWQFYVVGVATKIFKGTFSMKIWVEQNDEPDDIPEVQPANVKDVEEVIEVQVYEEEQEQEQEESNNNSNQPANTNTNSNTNTNTNTDDDEDEEEEEEEEAEILFIISQKIRIDVSLYEWEYNTGSASFIANMADALNIEEKNVVITDIREGSVIIEFDLIVDSNSRLSYENLQTLADIMISSGAVDVGGDILDFETLQVTDGNGNIIGEEQEEEEEEEEEDNSENEAENTDVDEYFEVQVQSIQFDDSSSTTLTVTDDETSKDNSTSGVAIAAVVMCTLLIFMLGGVVFFVFHRQKNQQEIVKKLTQGQSNSDDDEQLDANDMLKRRIMRDRLELEDNLSDKKQNDFLRQSLDGSTNSQMKPNGNFDQAQMMQMFQMMQVIQNSNGDSAKSQFNPMMQQQMVNNLNTNINRNAYVDDTQDGQSQKPQNIRRFDANSDHRINTSIDMNETPMQMKGLNKEINDLSRNDEGFQFKRKSLKNAENPTLRDNNPNAQSFDYGSNFQGQPMVPFTGNGQTIDIGNDTRNSNILDASNTQMIQPDDLQVHKPDDIQVNNQARFGSDMNAHDDQNCIGQKCAKKKKKKKVKKTGGEGGATMMVDANMARRKSQLEQQLKEDEDCWEDEEEFECNVIGGGKKAVGAQKRVSVLPKIPEVEAGSNFSPFKPNQKKRKMSVKKKDISQITKKDEFNFEGLQVDAEEDGQPQNKF